MKLVASLLLAMVISSCSSVMTASETTVTTSTSPSSTTLPASSENSVAESTTSVVASAVTTGVSTSMAGAPSTTTRPVVSTVALSRPKLVVSQTNGLNPNGTSVTVRGTGFDVSKGVYVIVCSQAAPGPQATCIGGVNLDGSAPSSVWVSSNPPNYAIGLTTPFQPDGSFTVDLVVIAKSGALDCTVIKCGVVTRSDHLRYTDRTQDVFVPISFSNN